MRAPRTADVIVIGGGIVGAACADALSAAGLAVIVLERGFAASGTTAAGMGHIVAMDDSPAQLTLTAWSRGRWGELADEMPAACESERRGTIWIAASEGDLASARQRAAKFARAGVAASLLDADDLARAEPRLRRDLAGGILVEDDAVLYPPLAARWLLDRALGRGAALREGTTVVEVGEGTVVVCGAGGGAERLSAGAVVNAAGIAAPCLTPELPVLPRKGHLVITERHPELCRHQLVESGYLHSAHALDGESVAFNVQPRATGQLLIGSSREMVGHDSTVNPRIVAAMLARAIDFLPALAALSAIRAWTGFRPATPDGLPLIGPWPSVPGLWIAAGHEGLGITAATGTAALIAAGITRTSPPLDAEPYLPARVLASAAAARVAV